MAQRKKTEEEKVIPTRKIRTIITRKAPARKKVRPELEEFRDEVVEAFDAGVQIADGIWKIIDLFWR